MEHESPSNWLDAHLDGDGRWADADTVVLVDADDLTSAVADEADVVDAAPASDGGAWLDHAGPLPGLETDGVDPVLVTDDDLVDHTVPFDADIAVAEPSETPADASIVDPFDDFLARTSADDPDASTDAVDSPSDIAPISDDVAPAPAEPEFTAETAPPAVDPSNPAAPAPGYDAFDQPDEPAPGYDAFDQLDEPAAGDDWSVDLTPDPSADLSGDDNEPVVHDDDHEDGGDLA